MQEIWIPSILGIIFKHKQKLAERREYFLDNNPLENLKKEIGLQIYNLRMENGFSRQDFADMVGISLNSLSSIENGDSMIKISTLFVIVNTLSLPLSSFFSLIEKRRL